MDNLNNSLPLFNGEKESINEANQCNLSWFNANCNFELYDSSPLEVQKKVILDISDEPFFTETFNITNSFQCEEQISRVEEHLAQNSGIFEPINVFDSYERENNESFIHENNYFFNKFPEEQNSFDIFNASSEMLVHKFDSTLEDSDPWKFRKSYFNKTSAQNLNKTEIAPLTKQLGSSLNLNMGTSANKEDQNSSYSGVLPESKRRGRKKVLLDGFKREIVDKACIRQFKIFLKEGKQFCKVWETLDQESKLFWNEFTATNNPPFCFTISGKKYQFRSFSKSLMNFIFSHQSVYYLYEQFVKDNFYLEKLFNRKIKKIDSRLKMLYSYYGKNLHKLYTKENNLSFDFKFEEIMNTSGNFLSSNGTDPTPSCSDSLNNFL